MKLKGNNVRFQYMEGCVYLHLILSSPLRTYVTDNYMQRKTHRPFLQKLLWISMDSRFILNSAALHKGDDQLNRKNLFMSSDSYNLVVVKHTNVVYTL